MFYYILPSLFVFILYFLYQKRKNHFSQFRRLGIAGPKPNIFFGNALELYFKGDIQTHKEWISKYGKVVGYYYGLTPILLITDTDLLRNIQIKDFQKFIDRAILSAEPQTSGTLRPHLVSLKGSKWKEMRSVITPSFTTSKMKMMSPIMNEAIDDLLENFEKFCQSGEICEAYRLFQLLTLDVITRTAFGIQINAQKNPKDSLYALSQMLLNAPFRFLFLLIMRSFVFLQPLMRIIRKISVLINSKGVNPFKELFHRCEVIVNSRKADPTKRRADLLQLLIDAEIKENVNIDYQTLIAGEKAEEINKDAKETIGIVNARHLTMEEMVSNAFVFLLAGYDTTSTALAFCTLMLANFPTVQEKIREEVNKLLEEETQLDYVSVQKLQYLDQAFKEILRLYPPIHLFVDRIAAENVQYGKIRIKKGMKIQVPIYLLHRDPDYWEQPEEFRPERFEPGKPIKSSLAWQSFGAGPRNCVGMRFAQMEVKLVLARLIYKYRILLGDESSKYPFELKPAPIIIRPKFGVRIRLEHC